MKTLTIQIPNETAEGLEARCGARTVSIEEYAALILEIYIRLFTINQRKSDDD